MLNAYSIVTLFSALEGGTGEGVRRPEPESKCNKLKTVLTLDKTPVTYLSLGLFAALL